MGGLIFKKQSNFAEQAPGQGCCRSINGIRDIRNSCNSRPINATCIYSYHSRN